jgi:predicted RND superfamily exporter protein
MAAQTALAQIEPALPKLPASHPLAAIAVDLRALAKAPDPLLNAANAALTRFLPNQLDSLRDALSAEPVTPNKLPDDLTRDWRLPNGRVRVQVVPTDVARTNAGLRTFVAEVIRVAPEAGGSAVTIQATTNTIVGAFRSAAIGALIAIAIILCVTLRRPGDVVLVLAPLLLSALLTLLIAVLLPLPLNFANIIALPLLFGIGVAFHIYFVMSWRSGGSHLLTSSLARAVFFSALTTATGFGSLWASSHPGTASMGKLLMISLIWTLVSALLFQPALMGDPPASHAQPEGKT